MQKKFFIGTNGQEVQSSDINTVATEAALADDLVFAEMLRLQPYSISSTVARALLPFNYRGTTGYGTVSNNTTGGVCINPFRAIVGSRNATATQFTDIRSAVFVNATNSFAEQTIAVPAQSAGGGTTRIDLVYATLYVDQPDSAVTRYVYVPPGTPTSTGVQAYVKTYVTVGIVSGTAGVSPIAPGVPADPAGGYNIPLAYLTIANGFTAASVVPASAIVEVGPFVSLNNRFDTAPANKAYTLGSDLLPSSVKSSFYMPPSMLGRAERFVAVDGTIPATSTIDNSLDWRRRNFKISVQVGTGNGAFSWVTTASTAVPNAGASLHFMASSYLTASDSLLFTVDSTNSSLAAGTSISLFVSRTNGLIYMAKSGTPSGSVFAWIEASSQFTNLT